MAGGTRGRTEPTRRPLFYRFVSHYLEGSYFVYLTTFEEVEEYSKHAIQVLSGIARTFRCDLPIKPVLIIKQVDGHKEFRTVDPTVTVVCPLTIGLYEARSKEGPREFHQMYLAAMLDPRMGDAFRFLASGEGWYALYKVFETVGEQTILSRGWASREDVRRFKRTANFLYRHPGQYKGGTKPLKPMDIWEANRMVFRIVDLWVKERISAGGNRSGLVSAEETTG